MKIKCDCGFEEIPENFHAFCQIFEFEQHIYVGCPKCGSRIFFQHFRLPLPKTNTFGVSLSHLLNAPLNEKYPTWEKAMQYTNDQIKLRGFKPILEIIGEGEEKNVNADRC